MPSDTISQKVIFATDKNATYFIATVKYPKYLNFKSIKGVDFKEATKDSEKTAGDYKYLDITCVYDYEGDFAEINTNYIPFEIEFEVSTDAPLGNAEISIKDVMLIGDDTFDITDIKNHTLTILPKLAENIEIVSIFTKDTVTLTLVAEKTAAIDNNIKETGKNNIDNPLLKGYIYGLDTRLRAADLDEYLAVEGDGRLEYVLTKYNVAGTGTVVNVYDRMDTPDDTSDDKLVEQYIIVIFGDVNGDADIDVTDYSIVTDNNLGLADWANYDDAVDATNENYNHAMVLAANLNDDANVDGTDAQLINDVSLYAAEINQQTGEVIYY
jgi:hypothetical protein